MNPALKPLAWLGLIAWGLPLAAIADGSITAVEGKAALERGKDSMNVVAALPIQTGDTLRVQKQSKVQLQFDDDSLFTIPGAAVLRVDAFEAPEKGPGKAVYTLVDGGLRTITGRVSKNPQDVYELHTDVATITVKGSAYTALRCRSTCAGQKAGLYVKAEKGLITVANAKGKLNLRPGEVAYVETPESAPVRVQNSPFLDPVFASAFTFDEVLEGTGEPQRIEQESPVSPS
jgi:hypothetical protein